MARPFAGAPLAAALALVSIDARGHIELTDPPQRFAYSGDGQKIGPCGAGAPSGAVTTFAPGQAVVVVWTETVDHPGYFRISLDADGGDDDLVDPAGYDDFYAAPSVLVDDIEDAGGSSFSQTITLPMVECERCVLQVIQVMTDKPPWGPEGGNDIYYWCADIAISASGAATSSSDATTTSGGPGVSSGGSAGGDPQGAGDASGGGGGSAAADEDDGCAVRSPGGSGGGALLVGFAAAVTLARRRHLRSTTRRHDRSPEPHGAP